MVIKLNFGNERGVWLSKTLENTAQSSLTSHFEKMLLDNLNRFLMVTSTKLYI